MPPQPPTTFRIEDLKARLKLEPKSRLFYPLAEELRKIQRFADAEKVLRDGLTVHAGYISAWISLGRVLYELGKYREAVEILQKACTLDPGNVVAARLLADSHYALGEKVEAIKKYKLVRALLPVDEEINHTIARLEVELTNVPTDAAPVTAAQAAPEIAAKAAPETAVKPASETTAKPSPEPVAKPAAAPATPAPIAAMEPPPAAPTSEPEPFKATEPVVPMTTAIMGSGAVSAVDVDAAIRGGRFTAAPPEDSADLDSSAREEPFGSDARDFPLEDLGASTDSPSASELSAPSPERFSAAPMTAPKDDFDDTHPLPADPFPEESTPRDPLSTATMADLYARQGHADSAREIYSKILQTSPDKEGVREKLDSLADRGEQPPAPPESVKDESGPKRQKVDRLEKWLSHVARK